MSFIQRASFRKSRSSWGDDAHALSFKKAASILSSKWSLVKQKLGAGAREKTDGEVGSVATVLEPRQPLLTAATLRDMTESTTAEAVECPRW